MTSPDDRNPFEAPHASQAHTPPPPLPDRDAALAKLQTPAVLLLVLALIQAPMAMFGLAAAFLQLAGVTEPVGSPVLQGDPQLARVAELAEQLSGPLALATNGFALVAAIGIGAGAWQMRKAESWGLALAAAILAMIPISPGCCCCLGVPVGLYALVVLVDPDVKRAFR